MSTLDGLIWSRCSIALTCPPGHISSAHRAGKDGTRVGMNVTTYQKKEKNEQTKADKRKAREDKRQATDFKEAVWCFSAFVQGAAQRKNEGKCPG